MALAIVATFLLAVPGGLSAQTGAVQGRVLEEGTERPLEAVQVSVTGTQRGTLTATGGTFRIEGIQPGEHTVRAEFIGYQSVTLTVNVVAGETATADFVLEQSVLDLEEIVVTGVAGQQVRSKLPFSVDRLTTQSMPVPATSATSMLQGKVAGLRTGGDGGRPGAMQSVMLRGPTSINATGRDQEPLYIVDGVILAASMVDIDAMDIESIEVVKGAAAASLYGSRAANGVIQIATSRGKNVANDDVTYTVRSEFGSSDLPGEFNLTQRHHFAMTADGSQFVDGDGNACEFVRCDNVQLAAQRALPGAAPSEWNTIQQESWPGVTYDHVDRFFTGGNFMTNAISAAGRSGGTNYFVSYNYLNNEGIMPGHDGMQRHNFRINLDQAVRENITVSASAFYSRSRQDTREGAMFALTRMPAGVDLTGPDPDNPDEIILKPDPFNDNANPLNTMLNTRDYQQRGRFLGSMTAQWKPLSWFSLDGNFSFDRSDRRDEGFSPKDFRTLSNPNGTGGDIEHEFQRQEAINGSITGQFLKQFGDLNTTTQFRYLIEQEEEVFTEASGEQFTADGVWTIDNTPEANRDAGSGVEIERADGFFVISRLDYKDRYIVDGLARNDGSSLFGPDERRHWYYRGSLAYRLSEEPWFNVPGIDELKVRYSYGTAGNRPNFSSQYETYTVDGGSITPQTLGNRNLKPEFVTEQEMGIDALFLNRFSVDLTYAHADAKDQILNVPLLAHSGFSSQWQNAGRLESNTIEASLSAQLIRTQDFTWNARVLFDRTRQEITELSVPAYQEGVGGQGLGNVFFVRPGEALGTFYGFQFAENCGHLPSGVDCSQFQVNDDGYLVWVGDAGSWQNGWDTHMTEEGEQHWWGTTAPFTIRGGNIRWGTPFQGEGDDPITGERTTFLPLGQAMPDYSLSLANTFTWKGLSLYGLLQSIQGSHVYNQPLQWAVFQSYAGIMDESGTPDEDLRKPLGYYSAIYGASGLQPSSAFVDDASFVKLQELSLRYQVPTSLLGRVPLARGFSGLGLTVIGRNLLTWTDYDGYDPDVGRSGGGVGSAVLARVDGFDYPNFRTVTFGIDITF
jgi:TonB-linked SusC/RagA family outer membrane protein